MLVRAFVSALAIVWVGCSGGSASGDCQGFASETQATLDAGPRNDTSLVVDTCWLQEHLNDPDIQVIDTRPSGYAASRIPGAIHLTPTDVSADVEGVPFQVAPPAIAEPELRAAGLRNGLTAVVYGGPPEYDPSWIVWALRYFRHGDVRYLDGGIAAWIDAGGPLDTAPPTTTPTDYTIADVDDGLVVTGDWVLSQLGGPPYAMPAIQLVDARSEGEYDSGHIPSARNVNWTRNLRNGFLRPRSELDPLYRDLDPTRSTVTYCVTGLRGSFDWLTLAALGYEDVRLYDGSWAEWGNGDFPVEQ